MLKFGFLEVHVYLGSDSKLVVLSFSNQLGLRVFVFFLQLKPCVNFSCFSTTHCHCFHPLFMETLKGTHFYGLETFKI